ncbi:MHYT domain-containing protein [Nocardiopsis listeri]|uniref:MHYT domain-containing protein n=1 Tax=Nocardiopsis listeri TaxID=53440 RepID=UPI0008337D89|nr:MHYT domain-containing protein [Nocardiopsis listeri]
MIDHFNTGLLTPIGAYGVSVIGSFIGLMFARRLRTATGAARWWWPALSAICLGGTAIWSMHFIAMLGFQVHGTPVRYDAGLTMASGLLPIFVMAVALFLMSTKPNNTRLLISGVIAGSGIVSMHYIGMASMNMHGEMHHDPLFVALATVIALVAATVALWFSWRLRGTISILAAALVMGVAVSAMHYTGMLGVDVTLSERTADTLAGSTGIDLLLPLVVGLFVFLLVCSLLLMLGVEDRPHSGERGSHRRSIENHG